MATQLVEYAPEVLFYVSEQELDEDLDEDDEEVYRTNSGPGSTQDIWKKFELTGIPTPPLSPSRQATSNGASSPTCLTSSAADTLQSVSDILDVDNSRTTLLFPENSCANLKSKLIQDCMWGSNEKIQRVIETVYATPCATPPPLDYVSADCVDPSSVFPYPINNQEFTSDSSEDEGEIDVVTIIEKAEKPVRRKLSQECPNDNVNVVDDDDELSSDSETAAKKPKIMHKRLRSVKETQDPQDKLEGPECKRNVHNVLERKRRNDLKYSFQVLRDSVPDLKGSERAPKVAILKKATDCIHNLRNDDESLTKQKDILMQKHIELRRKLMSLQESAKWNQTDREVHTSFYDEILPSLFCWCMYEQSEWMCVDFDKMWLFVNWFWSKQQPIKGIHPVLRRKPVITNIRFYL